MITDGALSPARFPTRFLTATVVFTGMALVWLGWDAYESYRVTRTTSQRNFRIQQLRGAIVHLDEVLTMSARMGVATGLPRWEKRYLRYEPILDAAIKEAIKLAPESYSGEAAAQTDAANTRLVEMEHQAFALVRQGRVEAARDILSSYEYQEQKEIYAEGMKRFADFLSNAAEATLKAQQQRAFMGITSVIVVIVILLVGWLVVLRTMRNWRAALVANHRQLAQQAQELADLNRELDRKVTERTKELQASEATTLDMLKEAEEARASAEQAEKSVIEEQQLLREMLSVQERDRKLVAFEIHDGFAQKSTGALMSFQAFQQIKDRDSDKARKIFDEGLGLLNDAITEARRLIGGLRPPILDESGVLAAVDYLVREARERGGPEIEFHHDVHFDRLAPQLESAIFRIVQETLTNARRHSQTKKIRVELVQQNGRIRVEVRDWGVGFDPTRAEERRFGLKGIRERARLLGGEATIDAVPNRGTRVVVELPLVEKAHEETQQGPHSTLRNAD